MLDIIFGQIKENFSNQKDTTNPGQTVVPLEIEVAIYVILIIISTGVVVAFRKRLNERYFKDKYLIFYAVFVANLANLVWFSIYYNSKKKVLVGKIGPQGDPGLRGRRGDYITCSFCDHNLFVQKTKDYNKIVTLSVGLNKDELNNNNNTNKMIDIVKNFGIDGFGVDYEEFDLSTLQDPNNIPPTFIEEISIIFDQMTRMTFMSYYLNEEIMKGNYSKEISFFRPIGGNGKYPVGYSVFKSGKANKSYAFLINGDIRLPESYEPKFTFQNQEDVTKYKDDEGNIQDSSMFYYTFMKPIPPKEYQIITDANIKTEKVEPSGNTHKVIKYVSMGEIIVRTDNIEALKPDNKTIDPSSNYCACIRLSCARRVKYDELELVAVKISYNITEDNQQEQKVNKILNFLDNANNGNNGNNSNKKYSGANEDVLNHLDVYSVWKTPMNTFVTNCLIQDTNTHNGTLGHNIVNRNKHLLTRSGYSLNKKGRVIVKEKLQSIKLPRIIRIVYIMVNQYNIFFDEIVNGANNVITILNGDIEKLKRKNNNRKDIRTKDQKTKDDEKLAEFTRIVESMESIIAKLGSTKTPDKKSRETRQKLFSNFESIQTIMNGDNQTLLKSNIPKYNNMKSKLTEIPTLIDSRTTLYDMLLLLFPEGLNTYIGITDKGIKDGGIIMSSIQKEILKICMVCMPPDLSSDPVYMPKDSCLSFESISITRRKLVRKFENSVKEFNTLESKYRENPESCIDYLSIQNDIRFMYDRLYSNLNQIPDYQTKIDESDIEKFSDSRLRFIINEYQKVIKRMKTTCKDIDDDDKY